MEEDNKNTPIEIMQVNNGFEVIPSIHSSYNNPEATLSNDDKHVFESLSGLTNYLKNHFTHRNQDVIHD